jgi:hypothetical protein
MRTVTGLASVVVVALLLTGCTTHKQRAADIAAELENLPGVISVSANGNDRGIASYAGQTVWVDVEQYIDPVDAAAIVKLWIDVGGSDDSSSSFTMSTESTLAPDVPLGDHSIHLEHRDIDAAQASAAASLWATLLPTSDRVIVRIDGDSDDNWFSVASSRAVDAPSLSALVAELDGAVAPELRALDWSIGASADGADSVSGVSVSTNGDLPDAELLALIGRLDGAMATASRGGGFHLHVADNSGSGYDRDPAYSLDLTLEPEDLRDVPSNQTQALIPTTSSWVTATAFADAITVDDDLEFDVATFDDRAFARLLTTSCALSIDPERSQYGADLWAYWLRFGATSADGSTATACV